MSILSSLYTLIISPLMLLFEVVFTIANRVIGNEGLSIIFLSLAVNFLVLPLYKRADELQAEERDIQAKMAPHIKHIKQVFKGDERFFMLQEYYRVNHYKPVYALKSSVSLLLQIPFFIAAYNLLSGMECLQGMTFGFIKDLGSEDAMFMIGSFPVNVLPILMTLVNIFSGIIYTKGHPLKAKIQVYGLAAVFLVLLYHSPSGLVFYWLLNNVFSLVKNIFYKLKNSKKILSYLTIIVCVVVVFFTLIRSELSLRQKSLITMGCLLICLPSVLGLIKVKNRLKSAYCKENKAVFYFGCVFMALTTGFLIPTEIIRSSTLEFINILEPENPLIYVANSMFLSFGSCVLWPSVFFSLMEQRYKAILSRAVWVICGISIIDYMFFGTDLGNLTSMLQYENSPVFVLKDYLINSLVIIFFAVILYYLVIRFPKIPAYILMIGLFSVAFLGIYNSSLISTSYNYFSTNYRLDPEKAAKITLSTKGQNVIVLMLDRAMGTEVPYIFNEKPEILEQFDGFTYYPNTLSYGPCTNTGSPALYGGYEYTPENINMRNDESLESKQNEALKVMPVLFGESGYNVTICDPTYAGYSWIPDLSIFDDHPEFNCYITKGHYSLFDADIDGEKYISPNARANEIRNRNFFCYSLMKVSPLVLQETIYDGGLYNEALSFSSNSDESGNNPTLVQQLDGLSKSYGYSEEFIKSFPVLQNLPEITVISNDEENNFLMMSNDTTHAACLLQEPYYLPKLYVDNTAYDINMVERYTIDGKTMEMSNKYQYITYHVNMAAFIQLGKWFDYLRENGVYDNTRIILVADHGQNVSQFDITCNDLDMECFMPLLMVKDFNAKGFTVCEDFMTNGDTPCIATSGIINDPINPFTGNALNSGAKNGPQNVFFTYDSDVEINNGNTFLPGSWYTFTGGDVHDPESWVYVGDY